MIKLVLVEWSHVEAWVYALTLMSDNTGWSKSHATHTVILISVQKSTYLYKIMYVGIFKHWIYCVHIIAVSVWVDPPASVMTYKSSVWSLVTLILLTAKKHIAECFQINIYKMVFCMPFLPWMLLGHIHLVAPFWVLLCMVARLACLWNLSFLSFLHWIRTYLHNWR